MRPMTSSPTRPERMARLPYSPLHTKVLLGSGTGWALDAMDVGLISFVGLAIATQWDLTKTCLLYTSPSPRD